MSQDPETLDRMRCIFVDGVLLLGLDVEQQLASLPDFVPLADELALTFDDGYILLPQLVEAGLVSAEAAALADELSETFDAMGGEENYEAYWTEQKVADSPEWAAIRSKARALLEMLGETLRPPGLAGVTYVKGATPPETR